MVQVGVHAYTSRSRLHSVNEDRAVVGGTVLEDTAEVVSSRLDPPALVAVLDGLGGHPAGDVASDVAARSLAGAGVPGDDVEIAGLLQEADRAVDHAMAEDPSRAGMGTTVAMLVLLGEGGARVANVGDSSVWRLTADGLLECSVSDRGSHGALLQCLGVDGDVEIAPHVGAVRLDPGDRVLLATDGLTDVVPAREVEAALRGDLAEGVAGLVARVDAAGRPDDVTIMVVEVPSA